MNTPPSPSQPQISAILLASVSVVVHDLSDQECCAIFLPLVLGNSIEGSLGFEKLRSLFTEKRQTDKGEIEVMHPETKSALIACLDLRIHQMQNPE